MADSHDTTVMPNRQPGGSVAACPTRRHLLAAMPALGGATEAFPATAATVVSSMARRLSAATRSRGTAVTSSPSRGGHRYDGPHT